MKSLNLKNLIILRVSTLIINRFRNGFDKWYHGFAFLVSLVPPLNLFFSFFCKIIIKKPDLYISKLFLFLLQKGFGWGALRHISPENRTYFANFYYKELNLKKTNQKLSKSNKIVLNNLKNNGFASLGVLFTKNEIKDALYFFSRKPFYSAQVPVQGRHLNKNGFLENYLEGESRYRCILRTDSEQCRQLQKFIKNNDVCKIANEYLKIKAPIYSISTFATFPGKSSHYVLKEHRDYDHFFSLTFFIAWTDTKKDDGATLYMPKTHKFSKKTSPVPLEAKAGEVFAIDTFGLHSGNPNLKKTRVATWVRFGILPNYASIMTGDK